MELYERFFQMVVDTLSPLFILTQMSPDSSLSNCQCAFVAFLSILFPLANPQSVTGASDTEALSSVVLFNVFIS